MLVEIDFVIIQYTNEALTFFAACFRATQPVYVSRTDPDSRKKTISEIKRRASSGGKWPHIVIFPEGDLVVNAFVSSFADDRCGQSQGYKCILGF